MMGEVPASSDQTDEQEAAERRQVLGRCCSTGRRCTLRSQLSVSARTASVLSQGDSGAAVGDSSSAGAPRPIVTDQRTAEGASTDTTPPRSTRPMPTWL